jgi:hypothetical protein
LVVDIWLSMSTPQFVSQSWSKNNHIGLWHPTSSNLNTKTVSLLRLKYLKILFTALECDNHYDLVSHYDLANLLTTPITTIMSSLVAIITYITQPIASL